MTSVSSKSKGKHSEKNYRPNPTIWFYDDTPYNGIRNLTYYNNTTTPLLLIMFCEVQSKNKTNGSMSIAFKNTYRNLGLSFGSDVISDLYDLFMNIIASDKQSCNKITELATISEYKDDITIPYHFSIKLTDSKTVKNIITVIVDLLAKYNLLPEIMKEEVIIMGTKNILKFIQ